jgi:DNA-binding transcriptional LysR family regulator
MMRIIDLDALEIFRTVVEEGGIVRAAATLHRVPSNVTTRVKQLEERLGVPLFRRRGRSLAITAEGEVLLSYADRLLRLAEEAEAQIRSATPRGVLRLGAIESAAGSRLPALLASFHRRCPDIVVELVTGTTAALLQRVGRFEIEAAFVSEPFTAGDLATLSAFDEELVLITAKTSGRIRGARGLRGSALIAFPSGCSYRTRLEEWLGSAGIVPARTMDLASYQAIVACVAAGSGFAAVPRSLLASLPAADVRQHELPARTRLTKTHLVWKGTPSTALRLLKDLLVEDGPPARR